MAATLAQKKGSIILALLRLAEHGVFAVVVGRILRQILQHGIMRAMVKPLISRIIAGARYVPGVKSAVEGELEKEVKTIEKNMLGDGDPDAICQLPAKGLSIQDAKKKLLALKSSDLEKAKDKHAWAGIYHESATELSSLQATAMEAYHETNALYPGIFPSLRKMEAEVTAMTVSLVNGNCGLLTSGGTESVYIAALAHRERGRQRGIEDPEVICCRTCHPAIDKACHYFGMKLVKLDQDDAQQLSAAAVRGALTRNTVLVYSSAPTFPHGVVDPIEDLGSVCKEKDVGLHVDNCLGGIYLSFLHQCGAFRRGFDFRVPGVTTMSVDLHKYGYASKGVSVVAFGDNELRRVSYVPVAGLEFYVTPTLQGSRGGASIAAAWATLVHYGKNGYDSECAKLLSVHQKVTDAVAEIPGIKMLLKSDACIIPITGDGVDIWAVAAKMEKSGWNLFTAREPPCMCLCYGAQHIAMIDVFVKDLRICVEHVQKNPKEKVVGEAAVYGAASVLPDDVLSEVMRSYCDIKLTVKPLAAS